MSPNTCDIYRRYFANMMKEKGIELGVRDLNTGHTIYMGIVYEAVVSFLRCIGYLYVKTYIGLHVWMMERSI